ncbi:hypothetical protein Ocepr_0268 [Oceanithermus profundus DSM 14977]|uniref:Uncharacterized protein n=1 Tax=Oceanithermus profundus (strain DSM 14977 / NBRC 100410 / VKM B-2274 / 506) TaxID=670487 RepID=E4U5W6_OCEP5|nr:hypothetical protein [Oceanithermus profundus]ADR35730.1 hypothetical protein Ocepr_0268 [Oceanithermus profundus DSM 14977]
MFVLETLAPLAAGPEGFPRRDGAAYLPGAALREALLTAALSYAIERDEAFAAEMRRFTQHAFKGSAGELAAAMLEALLARQPELEALAPADLPLAEPARRRVLVVDTAAGRVEGELELELFEGRAEAPDVLQPELETWLAAAARRYRAALASAEAAELTRILPESAPLYRSLEAREGEGTFWPLRVGFWTPEPEGGRFLAFARSAAADRALERRFRARPLPRRIFYDPETRRSLGWANLRKEG